MMKQPVTPLPLPNKLRPAKLRAEQGNGVTPYFPVAENPLPVTSPDPRMFVLPDHEASEHRAREEAAAMLATGEPKVYLMRSPYFMSAKLVGYRWYCLEQSVVDLLGIRLPEIGEQGYKQLVAVLTLRTGGQHAEGGQGRKAGPQKAARKAGDRTGRKGRSRKRGRAAGRRSRGRN